MQRADDPREELKHKSSGAGCGKITDPIRITPAHKKGPAPLGYERESVKAKDVFFWLAIVSAVTLDVSIVAFILTR